MLKLTRLVFIQAISFQPPSGGCVLKLMLGQDPILKDMPAAFRRLCVETPDTGLGAIRDDPAAFRRLCVETLIERKVKTMYTPSRLQAAVC